MYTFLCFLHEILTLTPCPPPQMFEHKSSSHSRPLMHLIPAQTVAEHRGVTLSVDTELIWYQMLT